MSQIKKGAFLNYVTIFLTTGVGLLLTPFIIRQLGDSEYGLYTLIGSLVGYMSVLDFGLSNTIVRFVAKFKAEKDRKGEENFLSIAMLIYFVISILIVIIGTVLYFNLEKIFSDSLTIDQIDRAKIMFAILIFNLAIALPGGAFTGICSGYEQFVFPKSVNVIRYIVRSLTLVALLLLGGKAIAMVVLDTIMNVLVIVTQMFYVFKKLKVRFKLHQFNIPLIQQIFGYSVWMFVWIIVGQFQWQVGQMVLGIRMNTTVVAIYSVGIMLGGYYGAFSSAITGVFLPRATKMTVAKVTADELTDMMIKIGRISFIVLLYILGAFLLYGKQFVFLWVGKTYYNAWVIALIIMIGLTFPLTQYFGTSILEARNKLAFKSIIYLIFLIIGTAIGYYLVEFYGEIGMVIGSVSGMVVAQILLNIYYYKVLDLKILRFFLELFNKTIIAFFLVLVIGVLINHIPGENWINFGIKAALYTVVYSFVIYHLGMIGSEKLLFTNSISSILNRNNDQTQ